MKRSPLLVIFITVFIDLVGFGIVIPVLPFYVEGTKFHASTSMVGLLFASYSVMQFIFTPVLGRLSDRYGRRPILLISLLGTCVGFLILGFATTLWMLFVGRILSTWDINVLGYHILGISVPFIFAGCMAFANAVLLYFTLPETVTPDHPARASAASGRWSQLIAALKQRRLTFVLVIYFLFV